MKKCRMRNRVFLYGLIVVIIGLAGTVLAGNLTTLTFDDNGNQMDDGSLTYEWDYANRLRRVTRKSDGQVIAEYAYDAWNRRVRKIVTHSASLNGTTDFGYDDWQAIEERDVGDVVTQQYVYGRRVDEPLTMDVNLDGGNDATDPGDSRRFLHHDAQGSTFALTDDSAATVEGYQYDAYGAVTVFSPGTNGVVDFGLDDGITANGRSDNGNPYLFMGRRIDGETVQPGADAGRYYLRNRYFGPELGRFLQRDPIRDPANFENGYTIAGNDPVNRVDPYGLNGDRTDGPTSVEQAQRERDQANATLESVQNNDPRALAVNLLGESPGLQQFFTAFFPGVAVILEDDQDEQAAHDALVLAQENLDEFRGLAEPQETGTIHYLIPDPSISATPLQADESFADWSFPGEWDWVAEDGPVLGFPNLPQPFSLWCQ